MDELCERIGKFPESKSKVGFIVSIFAIYEFTRHQDFAIECADFCMMNSHGNHGIASACSTLLCRIADNCANSGWSQEACRDAILKTMRLSSFHAESSASPFSILRAISEASSFCRRVRIRKENDSQPGVALAHLSLRGRDVFSAFLSAFENVFSVMKDKPDAINEFIFSCMEMCRACKADIFVSAVSVLSWSSQLSKEENEKYVCEAFSALQAWDRKYLECLEIGILGALKPGNG